MVKTERKYILERSLLQRGDIILTAESEVVSKGVRLSTLSKYSHAALWIGGTLIEAVRPGVFSKSVQRLIFDKPSHCAVYRSRVPLSDEQLDVICRYARSQVGTLYALDEAMMVAPRRLMKMESTKRQFCSRLVALAYAQIEYDFINLKSPHYCTPQKLARCSAFEQVKGLVRPADAGEIAFAQSFDPINKNAVDTFEWLGLVRSLVESDSALRGSFDIQSISDVNGLLLAHPELDGVIVEMLHQNDYLTFYDHDAQANPHRYDAALFAERLGMALDREDFIAQELQKEYTLISHQSENVWVCINNFYLSHLGFTLEHLLLYRNILGESWKTLSTLAVVCEVVGMNEWTDEARQLMHSIRSSMDSADEVFAKQSQ
ncbi:hypothetical protein AUC60_01580 [Pseudomonas caspiana]|uniref:Permuted papain-like amidase enzyme, YaeF/YiiX, C92 family n=1 Tax=Pseudomonas caspiana TaxID=1451454 RepID=A0A1Y3PDY5_9PSED|nr:hypothetical protein AUC60_01580 [Pseudomonas caspiana]